MKQAQYTSEEFIQYAADGDLLNLAKMTDSADSKTINQAFLSACTQGHLNIIEHLWTTIEARPLTKNGDFQIYKMRQVERIPVDIKALGFKAACKSNQLEVVRHLSKNDKYNIYDNQCEGLITAYKYGSPDIKNYFLYEFNSDGHNQQQIVSQLKNLNDSTLLPLMDLIEKRELFFDAFANKDIYSVKQHSANFVDNISVMNNAFIMSCSNGFLQGVKYTLTSPDIKTHANIDAMGHWGFRKACMDNYLDIIKYLTSSPDLIEYSDIYSNGGSGFTHLCRGKNSLEAIKYLTSSPHIKQQFDINHSNCDGLTTAYSSKNLAVVEYFLFDKNMQFDDKFMYDLKQSKTTSLIGLIELIEKRDLFLSISSQLEEKETTKTAKLKV